MEFQTYLDPFGTALRLQSAGLQIEGERIKNQMGLVELGAMKEKLNSLKLSNAATAQAFADFGLAGGGVSPEERQQRMDKEQEVESPDAGYARIAKLNFDLAKAASLGGDRVNTEKYLTNTLSALKDVEAARKARNKERATKMDDLITMASEGSRSPDAFGTALAAMADKYPNWDANREMKKLGFQIGPSGKPIYDGDRLRQLARLSMSEKDKLNLNIKQDQLKLTGSLRAIQASLLEIRAAESSRRAAAARDSSIEKHTKEQEKYAEQEKRSLHAEPVVKDFDKYTAAYDRAVNSEELLKAKGGYQNFTSTDAQSLVTAANNMFQGFRARYAGTKEIELTNKLNGFLRNMEKFATTVGEGEKRVAYDTALEMTQTMKDIYTARNVQVTRETLKRVQQLAKRGIDPDTLEAPGDIKQLVEQGLVKVEKDNKGNTYAVMRRPGSKTFDDRYLIKKADEEEQ